MDQSYAFVGRITSPLLFLILHLHRTSVAVVGQDTLVFRVGKGLRSLLSLGKSAMVATFSISTSDNWVLPYCYNLVILREELAAWSQLWGRRNKPLEFSATYHVQKQESASKLVGLSLVIGSVRESGRLGRCY